MHNPFSQIIFKDTKMDRHAPPSLDTDRLNSFVIKTYKV